MATAVPMGIVSLKAEGAYAADKLYKKGMWVTSSGSSYAYINPTPAAGIALSDTSHWQQIASIGGQDLVDAAVAARDAAQGYKDAAAASALQLAAGLLRPKGVYADLAALNAGTPTVADTDEIYITLDDGKWCYYSGAAWVAGGVYQTLQGVDPTLTLPGNAADAKAAGTELGFHLESLDASLVGQYDPVELTWETGLFMTDFGTKIVTGFGTAGYQKASVAVQPGERYRITGKNKTQDTILLMAVTNGTTGLLSTGGITQAQANAVVVSFEFTIPPGGQFLRLNKIGDIPGLDKLTRYSRPNLAQCPASEFPILARSANRFDKDSTENEVGFFWTEKTKAAASGYLIAHGIPVKSGDVVRAYNQAGMGVAGDAVGVFQDSFGTTLYKVALYATPVVADGVCTFTVPNDGRIAFVSLTLTNLNAAMVTVNEAYPGTYAAFDDTYRPIEAIGLNYKQKSEAINLLPSKLFGKLIAYNGDSICAGSDYVGGYARIISELTGGTYENRSMHGGVLVNTVTTPTSARHICEDVANMAADADLICFQGGINDYWGNVQIGTFTTADFTGALDTATLSGALESIFRQAIVKWAGKPICFIITHKVQTTATSDNAAGDNFTDWHNRMVEICNKYSIPYYDAFLHSGMNCAIETITRNFTLPNEAYEWDADGCHPTEAGYRAFYVPQLIALFKSLMP